MASFADRTKLPELFSLGLDKSIATSGQPSWTQKGRKTKPTFLAKKITTTELLDEGYKITTLGQINEEQTKEVDDVTVVESLNHSLLDEEPGPENIFKADALVTSKYKEVTKGPVFTNTGQLVKHSIVGSADLYERYQRSVRKQAFKESGVFSERDNISFSDNSASRVLRNVSSNTPNYERTPTMKKMPSLKRIGSVSSVLVKTNHSNSERKRDLKKNIRISKEDLYMKIDEMRKAQDKFYQKESKKYNNLPLGDQLHHTKDQRCLAKYENLTNHWDQTIDQCTRKIRRNYGKSVMLSSDDFREKVEEAEAFNLVQTDHERFGTTFWYMTLRKYGPNDDMGNQRVIQDIPSGFNSPQIVRPGSSLEMIRKPSKLSRSCSTLPTITPGDTKWLDRTRKEYIADKTELVKTEMKRIRHTPNIEVDDFVIEGRNKLELEVTAFFKNNPYKDTFNIPKTLFKDRQEEEEDGEYIVVNYDNKEVIKNGLTAFVQ